MKKIQKKKKKEEKIEHKNGIKWKKRRLKNEGMN